LALTIDRYRHRLGWLIDLEEDAGNRRLARGVRKTYRKQQGSKEPSKFKQKR
jgi:hypothetical protein